jgi:hypothetical protein
MRRQRLYRPVMKVRCKKCGQWKEGPGAWCPNYRSHGSRYKVRQKRFVPAPRWRAIPKGRATAEQIAEAVRICGTGGYEAGIAILLEGDRVVGVRIGLKNNSK